MKKLISRLFSNASSGALSFAAKSTLIGFGSLSASGAFAGSSPSFIRTIEKMKLKAVDMEQMAIVQTLVVQKLETPDLNEEDRAELVAILSQISEADQLNENAATEN